MVVEGTMCINLIFLKEEWDRGRIVSLWYEHMFCILKSLNPWFLQEREGKIAFRNLGEWFPVYVNLDVN